MPAAPELPHRAYAEAVAAMDGPGGAYEPDEWSAQEDGGRLEAGFYYRRTGPRTVWRDGLPAAVGPVLDTEEWPHGMLLFWNSVDGWSYAALTDEWGGADFAEPLPVDRLASPAAIRAVLPLLLAGDDHDLPACAERWDRPRAAALAGVLAAADAARSAGRSAEGQRP
ncbi:hypothetical protein [Streptomyces sp. NPDC002044]|uniref:hypothetical protein n=1 Tax=Streptomyces sp. NPDC002044 TaxID=3154662 RepID=UPI003328ECE6